MLTIPHHNEQHSTLASADIFEFIALIYAPLADKQNNTYVNGWKKWQSNQPDRYLIIQRKIKKMLAYALQHRSTNHASFLAEYTVLLHETPKNIKNIYVDTLLTFNTLIGEIYFGSAKRQSQEYMHGTIFSKGLMNSNCNDIKCYIYLASYSDFQETLRTNAGIRPKRSMRNYPLKGITHELSYIVFLDDHSHHNNLFSIKEYPVNKTITDTLRIALVPFANNPWYTLKKDWSTYTFDISEKPEEISVINNAYIHCINTAIKKRVHILVFLELSMNSFTLDGIKNHLCKTHYLDNSLLLIFSGSHWNNKTNKAYAINSAGNIIGEISKKAAFDRYESDVKWIENIIDDNSEILLLDLDGIGRISYSICKDALDESVSMIKFSYLRANLDIISAYSENSSSFSSNAKGNASKYGAITVFCNSCAALKRNTIGSNGFVCVPQYQPDKSIDGEMFDAPHNTVLCESSCKYGRCMDMITISSNKKLCKNIFIIIIA